MNLLRRRFLATQLPNSPPAIWDAFARTSAFKSWLLVAQLFVIAGLFVVIAFLLSRPADLVVITADGNAQFVASGSVEGKALRSFLATQRGQPSDLEIHHLTREFVGKALALNASTIDSQWPEAVSMMSPALASRLSNEAAKSRLLEGVVASGQKSSITVKTLDISARTTRHVEVRARLARTRSGLLDSSSGTSDALELYVLYSVTARTEARPHGLEVADFELRRIDSDSPMPSNQPLPTGERSPR